MNDNWKRDFEKRLRAVDNASKVRPHPRTEEEEEANFGQTTN
jgi:hypothetical protein